MRVTLIVAALLVATTLYARSGDALVFTRTVPHGAAMNYTVSGRTVQSMDLRPGVYRITIERIGGGE